MTTLKAKELTLEQVQTLLGFVEQPPGDFVSLLNLEPLTESENQELVQIREDFKNYLRAGKVLEQLVKVLTTYPLLRLAGFYRTPIKLAIEQDIAEIVVEDEDTRIVGTIDILAFDKTEKSASAPENDKNQKSEPQQFFWVLVIESKNSTIAPSAGLSQLLTYAYKSLEYQRTIWGLITNGELYQFVHLRQGSEPNAQPTYQLLPILSLMEVQPAIQLLQVLKVIGHR